MSRSGAELSGRIHGAPTLSQESTYRRFMRSRVVHQFRRSTNAMIGLFLTVSFIVIAIVAPVIAPHSPIEFDLLNQMASPSWDHPLGTDALGRDVLSRLIYGSRITLLITAGAVTIAVIAGTLMGLTAGFRGGWIDHAIMRVVDVMLAMPMFLLAIAIIAALGPGTVNVIIAVGIGSIPDFARVARGSTISVKQEDYTLAARALGSRNARIMFRHILPNVTAPLLVQTTLRLATAILTASGLSFLGLGPQPPTAEWGAMLSQGRNFIINSPQLVIVPGLAILLATIGFNLLGDGLRDALDPRMKR
jgi:peptide/nickel transport system permease protein